MAHDELEQVIIRSMNDENFLDHLLAAPEEALRSFNLSEEELTVLATGDEICLNELLGLGGRTAHINANKYHHSQHKGGLTDEKPDLLPRVVSEEQ